MKEKQEAISKRLIKYVAALDYFDKVFLSAASCGISIASFASIIVAPVETAKASFSFAFSITTGILKTY